MNNVLSEIFEKTSHFLSDCWAFQTLAFQYYKSPFKFYHPFSESVTKTSYFFKLFQHLELNYSNLFSIKYESTGVPFKSSSTEYIFTSYLKYCNPQNNIVDSFSPHGQPRLRHLIPDHAGLRPRHLKALLGRFWPNLGALGRRKLRDFFRLKGVDIL